MAFYQKNIERNIVLPDMQDSPHHPAATFVYLKHEFGKKNIVKRSFQSSWFMRWTWLHYCEDTDVVFCYTCVLVLRQKKMQLNIGGFAFTSKGFSNWKDATIGFRTMKPLLPTRKCYRLLYCKQLTQILGKC